MSITKTANLGLSLPDDNELANNEVLNDNFEIIDDKLNINAISPLTVENAPTISSDNSVAIGVNSKSSSDYEFSIGNNSLTRRITHVSDPIDGTDATTKQYVDETISAYALVTVNSTDWSTSITVTDGNTGYYSATLTGLDIQTNRIPEISLSAADSEIPTYTEQTAYNLVKFAVPDYENSTITLYATSVPTVSFDIIIFGVVSE